MNPVIQHSSNPLYNYFRSGFVVALILAILGTACNPSPPPDITDPGQLIYLGYADKYAQCSRCHGQDGQGGMFGPALRGVMQKRGIDSVRQVIRFGRGSGNNRMEGFEGKLSPAQIEQVISFISGWKDSLSDSAGRVAKYDPD